MLISNQDIMANARLELKGKWGAVVLVAVVYLSMTCTEEGDGWEQGGKIKNGLWTYWFLEQSFIKHFDADLNTPMESVFDYALDNYPWEPYEDDIPQQYDEIVTASFYL